MAEKEEKAKVEEEVKKEAEEIEEEEEVVENLKEYIIDGQVYNLTPEQEKALTTRGLLDYLKSQAQDKKEPEKKEEKKETKDEDKAEREAMQAKINELEKAIRSESNVRQYRELESRLEKARNTYPLTRDNAEVAETVYELTLISIQANPKQDVEKVYAEKLNKIGKLLGKEKSDYIKSKKEDAKKTKGAGDKGAASEEVAKFTRSDMKTGKLRNAATEFLRKQLK